MLLTRMLDTTVRGIVYEAAARSSRSCLSGRRPGPRRLPGSRIPYALLDADPADAAGLVAAAAMPWTVCSMADRRRDRLAYPK